MNFDVYTKNCPGCNKEISYSSQKTLDESSKGNKLCKSCSKRERYSSLEMKNKLSNGQKNRYSKIEERKKQSARLTKYYNTLNEKTKKDRIESIKSSYTNNIRKTMSNFQIKRFSNREEREKNSKIIKLALHRPDIRKKHLDALHQSKWIKVRTDKGQLELLEKWNRLGFNFEPNFQVKTEIDLFYVDGYDKERNVVIEYDGKYHTTLKQQKKDLIRQQKIINILKPKKFWRYDAINKSWKNVLEISL